MQQSGDNAGAIGCYQEALQIARVGDIPMDELLDLFYSLGMAHRYQGALNESHEYFTECGETAQQPECWHWAVRSQRAIGEVFLRQKKASGAVEAFSQAIAMAQDAGVAVLMTQTRLARALSDRGKQDDALRLANQVLQQVAENTKLTRTDRYAIGGQALLTLGCVRFRMGHYRLARRFLRRSLKLLTFTRAQLPRAEAMRLLGIIDSELKNFASALPRLYESWEVYRAMHYDPGRFDAYWSLATTYLDMGDLRNARLCLKQAETIAQTSNLLPEYAKTRSKLGDIETREGNYGNAHAMYLEDLRITSETSDRQAMGYCRLNLGRTCRRLGEMSKAEEHLCAAIQDFETTARPLLSAQVRLELAECYLQQGKCQSAEAVVHETEPVLRDSDDPGLAALADRMLGKIALERGNHSEALSHFTSSIELQLKRPPTRLLAETRFEIATTCHAIGDRVATLEHLRNAVQLAEALGSRDIRDAALRKLEEIDVVEAQALKLSPYLPSNAIEEMIRRWVDIDRHKLPVIATIMYVDMRGYTSLSGQTEAFDLVEAVETFLSLIVRIVVQHGGTVDKFIGDSVMATFGWRQTPEQGARMAVWAGMEIIDQLRATSSVRTEAGAGALHASIGINTGEVVAGCFGPLEKRDYTVIGYHVNLASRLQSLASEINVADEDRMLLSNTTYEIARGIVEAEPLPPEALRMKGIADEKIQIWRCTGRT